MGSEKLGRQRIGFLFGENVSRIASILSLAKRQFYTYFAVGFLFGLRSAWILPRAWVTPRPGLRHLVNWLSCIILDFADLRGAAAVRIPDDAVLGILCFFQEDAHRAVVCSCL